MKLEFQLSYDDVASSAKRRTWDRREPVPHARWVWAAIVLLGLGVLLIILPSVYLAVTVSVGWLWGLILPALVVFFFLRNWRAAEVSPEQWASNPLSRQMVIMELNDTGFRYDTPSWRDIVDWSAVQDVYEHETAFMVAVQSVSYIVPKRVLENSEQEQQFMRELATHFTRPIVRPKERGPG